MNNMFKGVFPVQVTAFFEDYSFDFEAAKRHLDYLIESGVHGVCVLGATGEYQSVSQCEHKKYVSEIVPYICNRVTVIVGASRERPEDVVELMDHAVNCGAHGAMVLPPFYCNPSQEEIYDFYEYINNNSQLPIVVYNNPSSAGVAIEADTYAKILLLKNVAVIKESSGDIQNLTELMINNSKDVSLFCGCDTLAYESFLTGADGWISMLANIAPKDCIALYNAVTQEKDYEKGFEIYKRLLPGLRILENYGKPSAVLKYMLKEFKGYDMGYMRRPRKNLSTDEQKYIADAMNIENIN